MPVCLSVRLPALPAIPCAPVAVAAAGIVLTYRQGGREGGEAEKEGKRGTWAPRGGGGVSHHSSARALCKYEMGEEANWSIILTVGVAFAHFLRLAEASALKHPQLARLRVEGVPQ